MLNFLLTIKGKDNDQLGPLEDLYQKIKKIWSVLRSQKNRQWNRVLPFGEYFVDRWEKASDLGFGKGTSIYDSAVVIGDVQVGENTWIGPNVILDGSGGLVIGDWCSIAAGVQIYSHDSVNWAVSGGTEKIERMPTRIGSRCYLGPNVIVAKGVTIGDGTKIGANSVVLNDIPPNSKAFGNPCKIS